MLAEDIDISSKKTYRWPTDTCKMLKITTNYWRNTNQNYSEVPPHTGPNGYPKVVQESTNNKCWRRCGEKGTLLHCWWECKLVQLLWKTVWRFIKKLKIKLPNDPAIPLLDIYPDKTIIQSDVHSSPIYNSQDMKTT